MIVYYPHNEENEKEDITSEKQAIISETVTLYKIRTF